MRTWRLARDARENCTTAVCNTLKAGGVLGEGENPGGALSFLHAPDELRKALESGDLSDEVTVQVTFTPMEQEKRMR